MVVCFQCANQFKNQFEFSPLHPHKAALSALHYQTLSGKDDRLRLVDIVRPLCDNMAVCARRGEFTLVWKMHQNFFPYGLEEFIVDLHVGGQPKIEDVRAKDRFFELASIFDLYGNWWQSANSSRKESAAAVDPPAPNSLINSSEKNSAVCSEATNSPANDSQSNDSIVNPSASAANSLPAESLEVSENGVIDPSESEDEEPEAMSAEDMQCWLDILLPLQMQPPVDDDGVLEKAVPSPSGEFDHLLPSREESVSVLLGYVLSDSQQTKENCELLLKRIDSLADQPQLRPWAKKRKESLKQRVLTN